MSKKYVIQLKSKVNGRAGRGTKKFSLDEAQRLAKELNDEYPDIEHDPIPVPPPESQSSPPEIEPEETPGSQPPKPANALS